MHGERAHATWSASSTSRNWNCAGALALGATVEQLDIESEAAAWGTACHQISEKCLKSGKDAESLIGTMEKTKRFSFEVDDELANTAQVYIDYVRGRMAEYKAETSSDAELYIEERFSLADLEPPFDAGGTGDAVMIFPAWELIEVVDLKGGRGIKVDVNENKQLRTYALGAMLKHPGRKISKVMSTVVQPRMGDGLPKSETYSTIDLLEWTMELTDRMDLSAEAMRAYADIKGDLTRDAWADKYVVAGDHCTFCPAAGVCPALEKKALAVADAFFNNDGQVAVRNQPSELSPQRLADVLDGADLLTGWLNAVRALATRLAQTGTDIENPATGAKYILTDRIGHRKFAGDFPVEGLKKIGIGSDDIYVPAMRSPAQLEKHLGSKRLKEAVTIEVKGQAVTKPRKDWLADLIHKPITGQSLVSANKTTRPAVKSAAEKFFS